MLDRDTSFSNIILKTDSFLAYKFVTIQSIQFRQLYYLAFGERVLSPFMFRVVYDPLIYL